MTQPLTLGCDCLGEIHYFDATLANEQGKPWVDPERDLHARGGLRDPLEARRPARRPPRGAPQPPARHQLHRDRRQLRVRLLLVLLPRRQHPARGEAHRHHVADGDRAGHAARVRERDRRRASPRRTTSTCSTPGSTSTSTAPRTRCTRSRPSAMPPGPDNPWAQRVPARGRRCSRPSRRRRRETDAATQPHVADREPERAQRPRPAVGVQAGADDVDARRCSRIPIRRSASAPASRSTTSGSRRTTPDERRAAGEYPNQHAGGDGLPRVDRGRPRRSPTPTSCVWYTFGVTHFVRPEDWPVMPVEYTGFLLTPFGFFDRNPALDVPANDAHCHARWEASDGQVDARGAAARARPLHGGRAGGRAHRRLAAVGRHVHRGRHVRRAPLRHLRRARGAVRRGSPRRWHSGRTPR